MRNLTENDFSVLDQILEGTPNISNPTNNLTEDPSEKKLSQDQKSKLKIYNDLILQLDSEQKYDQALEYRVST